jgi:hypothetical protein
MQSSRLLHSNGNGASNGDHARHLRDPAVATADEVPVDRTLYSAALVIGRLGNADILAFHERGLTVRPFKRFDSALAALLLGEPGTPLDQSVPLPRAPEQADDASMREKPHDSSGRRHSNPPDRMPDEGFAVAMRTELDQAIPEGPIREFFRFSALRSRRKLSPSEVAEAIGVDRDQITKLLEESGYPTAEAVIRWFRILRAAWFLTRTPPRSATEVASALYFSSGAVLGNAMKATIGMRPRELKAGGGFNVVLAQFRRVLREAVVHQPQSPASSASS